MPKFKDIKPYVLADIRAKNTPALLGEPGIGKTAFLKSLASELKTQVFVLSVNQLGAKEDLTGARLLQVGDDYQQRFYPHQVIANAFRYAKEHADETPILFMDEFNRTESDVTSALFTLITERSIGGRSMPDNLRLVVAGNDSGNIQAIDAASVTRLTLFHVEPDMETLLATSHFNPYIETVLRAGGETLPLIEKSQPLPDEQANDESDDQDDDSDIAMAEALGGVSESFQPMTVPRTIEELSLRFDALGLTGTDLQADITILRSLLENIDIFKDMCYGVTGNTTFTNMLIKSLVDTAAKPVTTQSQSKSTGATLQSLPAAAKKALETLGTTRSEMTENLSDLKDPLVNTLFSALISKPLLADVQAVITAGGANGQDTAVPAFQEAYLKTIVDATKTRSTAFTKALNKTLINYSGEGVNDIATKVMTSLPESNGLRLLFDNLF